MEAAIDAASARNVRAIEVEAGGLEDFPTTFARDQLLMLRCAASGAAQARVWRRTHDGLLLGRFHRAASSGAARPGHGGLSRRLTGGRVVPAGPDVVGITLAAPTVDWFDPAGAALRPDQVLNRALRPLLALLRGQGIDAFYPGRDLVTARGRVIAHASFTVARDGVAVVEMHVAERPAFGRLAGLLDRFDPDGVAGVDRSALAPGTSLEEEKTAARSDAQWAGLFADAAALTFACERRPPHAANGSPSCEAEAGAKAGAEAGAEAGARTLPVSLAHESAARDFLVDPGPVAGGARTAATVSMLGVVECSGVLRGDRLTSLRICGDVIAPFHTLDDIASECEGEPLRPASIRKALARALARPRSFLLGLRELDELILRLA